jgi:hypothetical protein
METIGYILLAVGIITGIVGENMFLVVAYKRSVLCFFGCLFVPLGSALFFVLNFKETLKPVGVQLLGLLLAGLGICMAGGVWR